MVSDSANLFQLLPYGPKKARIKPFSLNDWGIIDRERSSCLPACVFMGAQYYRYHHGVDFQASREYLQNLSNKIGSKFHKGTTIKWLQRYLNDFLYTNFNEDMLTLESDMEEKEEIENENKNKKPLFFLDVKTVERFTDLLLHLLIEPKMILILIFDSQVAGGRGRSLDHSVILNSVDLEMQKVTIIDPARYDPNDSFHNLNAFTYDALQFDSGWRSSRRKVIRMFIRENISETMKKLKNVKYAYTEQKKPKTSDLRKFFR